MPIGAPAGLPAVSAVQMAAVDRAMFDQCGLDVLQVMEIAGRSVAVWVRMHLFGGSCAGKRIAVLCGPGGNGGDGLVAAKHLQQWRADLTVVMAAGPPAESAAAHQLLVAERIGISVDWEQIDPAAEFDLIIDGLLGFGGSGAPRGRFARIIEHANSRQLPTVAIDVPSGLDATTGNIYEPCVRATATITLGLPKTGMLAEGAEAVTGRVIVADIGIPDPAFQAARVEVPAHIWVDDFVELKRI